MTTPPSTPRTPAPFVTADLPQPAPLRLRGLTVDAARPAVMAIINRTPDSFWAGARHDDLRSALSALDRAVTDGAEIIDVGGVRAGQDGAQVTPREEIERVLPFLEEARTRHPEIVLSLDTWRSEVFTACSQLVDLVNDTWAGHDPELVHAAAAAGAGIVCSHTGGLPPRTDPVDITYGPHEVDVVVDVLAGLRHRAQLALDAGLTRDRILLDPTLDFGKTTRHSLTVLRHTPDVVALGFPVMQAISRKDFIGETIGASADDRLEGTLAATAIAAWNGATVFRAHDVLATRRALDMVASLRGDRSPTRTVRGEVRPGSTPRLLRSDAGDATGRSCSE